MPQRTRRPDRRGRDPRWRAAHPFDGPRQRHAHHLDQTVGIRAVLNPPRPKRLW